MIEVYGKQFEIQLPTVKQVFEFQEKAKESANEFQASIELLKVLGFPEDVIDSLTADDFKSIIEYIFAPKKK